MVDLSLAKMMQSTSRPKLRKCCMVESTIIGDRITMLPDEIVISIVSHLKLAEAARTSILSRRWRYLWTYTTGILDFAKSDCTLDGWSIHGFIERVNLVLNLHKSCTIDEFRVCCVLREGSSDIIDNWINSALQRHVKRLVLDFGQCQFHAHRGHYALRAKIFSNCSSSLRSLTAPHLRYVDITGEVIEYILSNAPLLQELRLKSSYSLECLKIAGPSPHLRHLQIEDCYSMKRLEVHAINIVSFAYRGLNLSIYLKETSHLIEAKLDTIFCNKNIYYCSSFFSRLESLVLDLKRWNSRLVAICGDIPKLPSFRKLKQLEVSFSGIRVESYIFRCTKLLEASPSLQRFVLKIYDIQGCLMEADFVIRAIIHRRRKIKYQHKQLKVLELVGFLGHKKDVAIALSLLAILPSLQKLVIDPNPMCNIRQSNSGSDLDTDFDAYSDTTVATADQLLRKSLPRGAEFVVIPHSDSSCPK